MTLDTEVRTLYFIACDDCREVFEDVEYGMRFYDSAQAVTDAALDEYWTRAGEGAEERWHCPECPKLGEEPPQPGPDQERFSFGEEGSIGLGLVLLLAALFLAAASGAFGRLAP